MATIQLNVGDRVMDRDLNGEQPGTVVELKPLVISYAGLHVKYTPEEQDKYLITKNTKS